MKIATIVGARPQFVKAAVISRAIVKYNEQNASGAVREVMIHTGQHYDHRMSQVFFDELQIPKPHYNLEVGSGNHGKQTGEMLVKLEPVLEKEKPDVVLIYGDTNSTLAGAIVAAKMHIPIGHVEAGLRSYDKRMPEEVNRLLSDHISQWLFCPTEAAMANLKKEGITNGLYQVGDVMYDAALFYSKLASDGNTLLSELGVKPKKYILSTIHRAENTDYPERLKAILKTFAEIEQTIIVPLHPRAKKIIAENGMEKLISPNVKIIEPVSYLNMVVLEKNALAIMTDSGGVQKEAYFYGVPCLTMRSTTEWVETVESRTNFLVDIDRDKILNTLKNIGNVNFSGKQLYGDGKSGDKIVSILAGKS